LTYEDALKPENQLVTSENRRLREQRTSPNENPENYKNIQQFKISERKYEIGTWLDVKDTIEQWLEAQVMNVNDT
jgi:hypothetical protein